MLHPQMLFPKLAATFVYKLVKRENQGEESAALPSKVRFLVKYKTLKEGTGLCEHECC